MGELGAVSIDMDAEDDVIDRGDTVSDKDVDDNDIDDNTGDGEGGTDDAGIGEGDLSADELAGVLEENKPPGIPAGRVGELARERSLAVSISDSIVDGDIDPAAVKALGGTVAVAKMINSGDIEIADLASVKNVAPAQEQEPVNVGEKWKEYYEAMEDGDDDKAAELMGIIDAEQARLVKETATQIVDDRINEQNKKAAKKSERQEAVEANETATRVFSEYPELDENSADYDPVAFGMFSSAINAYRSSGNSLNEAIIKAENRVYKKDSKDTEADRLSGRDIDARRRNAKANNNQPNLLNKGSGNKDIDTVDLSNMSADKVAALPEKVKAKLRGDFVE